MQVALMRIPFLLLFIGIIGCSTLNSLNPFSSDDKSSSEKTQRVLPDEPSIEIIEGLPSSKSNTPEKGQAKSEIENLNVTNPAAASESGKPIVQAKSRTGNAAAKSFPEEQSSTAELLWHAPSGAVERYHLQYGYAEDKLEFYVEILIQELERSDHPIYGPLFRYVLKNISANQTLYFTIQAENRYGKGEVSPVQKVQAQ